MGNNSLIASTKKTNNRNCGFTMVEILVVLFVIGVLVGISVVGYGSWRKNVVTSQIKSDLRGVAGAMESARNFGSAYPTTLPTTFKPSEDITLTYKGGNSKTYCIEAISSQNSSLIFRYDIFEKKEPQSGACAVFGPTVTNLMHNPNPISAAYWKSSTDSLMSASFLTTGGNSTVRSTRLSTSTVALYAERNGVGIVEGTTGQQFTVMFKVVSSAAASLTFRIGYGPSLGTTTTLAGADLALNLVANVPQTISHTFTVPTGITAQPLMFKMLWNAGAGAVGDYFDVSRVMWVAGAYSGAYGDGGSNRWVWDSTENLSTSTGPTL